MLAETFQHQKVSGRIRIHCYCTYFCSFFTIL